jgi:hypothetical protein
MKEIKAIETFYRGYKFRSRLEARWAVFFDTAGIKWEYEKEGYDLGEEGYYLPDFWLPEVTSRWSDTAGVFVEIKPEIGEYVSDCEKKKLHALGQLFPTYCFRGLPWNPNDSGGYEFCGEIWDNNMVFMHCEPCNHVKIEFAEGNYMFCPKCKAHASDQTQKLELAYQAARQARFEFGQNGA